MINTEIKYIIGVYLIKAENNHHQNIKDYIWRKYKQAK